MKGLAGWKRWVLVGVSAALVGAVFLLQSSPPRQPEPESGAVSEGAGEDAEAGAVDQAADAFTVRFLAGEAVLEAPGDEAAAGPGLEGEVAAPVIGALPGPAAADGGVLPDEVAEAVIEAPSGLPVGDGEAGPAEMEAAVAAADGGAPGEAGEAVAEVVALPIEVVEAEVAGIVEARQPGAGPGDGRASRGAGRRIEFELEAEVTAAPAAAPPAEATGRTLALHAAVPQARGGDAVLRGSFGYRVPLVVRQVVPDQIRGGVYVPAHETYVIVRRGHWQLEQVGGDLTRMRLAPAEAANAPAADAAGSWFLLPWLRDKLRGSRGDGGQE